MGESRQGDSRNETGYKENITGEMVYSKARRWSLGNPKTGLLPAAAVYQKAVTWGWVRLPCDLTGPSCLPA